MGVRGRSPVRDYILILIGASIMGFAIKNIYDPIGLVTGGVSGVAIILKKQLGVPLWLTNTAINVPLFAAAARLKGWKFIKRTLVATVALSVSLYVIPEIPFLMDDLLLTALFGGIITGAGAGIVFACQATTGGTDMMAALIQRKLRHYSVAQVMQVLDGIIVIAGIFVFGIHASLYAIVAIYVTTKVTDALMEGMNYAKSAFIITAHPEQVADELMKELDRGASGIHIKGMYTGEERMMVFCVVGKKQIPQLKQIVGTIDPDAFVVVSDAREVLGEGFQTDFS